MWSDSVPAHRLARLRRRLLQQAPRARRRSLPARRALRLRSSAAALAARLRQRPGFVWLDDTTDDRHLIAFAPLLQSRFAAGTCTLHGAAGTSRFAASGFELLQALAGSGDWGSDVRLFGHLGYELARELEALPAFPPADVPVPDLSLGLHDLWLEGRGDRWWLCGPGSCRSRREVEAMRSELEGLATSKDAPGQLPRVRIRSRPTPRGYARAVQRTVARIHTGEIFEANICRRFEAPLAMAHAWPLYLRMRETGAARYGAFLRLPRAAILSRSPECFLRVRGGEAETFPIKGTRPRSADARADARQLRSLLAAEKDGAELAMIVDLMRNDLGRVCEVGSVRVIAHRAVMQLATVWHTYSQVTGRLRGGVDAAALLRAAFPPGSITGAPKIQAMATAIAEEPCRRGPAMGSIGWISTGGDLELSVAIRTAAVGGGKVVYHAGCGIVADSEPQAELDETVAKARVFLRALTPETDARLPQR